MQPQRALVRILVRIKVTGEAARASLAVHLEMQPAPCVETIRGWFT
jgi:hypothetical protein